jgi:hypothetical protein
MKKSVKKYQPGGLVDRDGNPVLDGSGNPIMTGSFPDEDEITARGRAKNAEMLKSFFNRATGRGKEAAPAAAPAAAGPAAGTSSLRDPQQMAEQKAAPKFSDGDVDESDRRREAAASAPKTNQGATKPKSGIVTKEELARSGLSLRDYMNKQQGKTRRDGTAPAGKAKTAAEYSDATDAMRNRSRMAANSANKKSSTTDALRAKSRREAAFEAAKRRSKTPEGQAQRKAQEKGQALERVTPEEYLVGGGGGAGLKTLHKAAKNLATPKIREYNPTMLPAPKAAPKVDTKALPAPTKRLEYDKKGALEARREAKDVRLKNEVAEENAARYGLNPRAPGYESAAKAVRKEMGEKDFSFKKGGSVRGAGIAQRGVRKCKMV